MIKLQNEIGNKYSKKNTLEVLEELNLSDNYFSIRGELVYINTQKKEFIIKICSSNQSIKLKNNNFKLVIKGELSLDILRKFLSLEVVREGTTLRMVKYEVVEEFLSKK